MLVKGQFKSGIMDAIGHVLFFQPSSKTAEHLSFVMDKENLTEKEEQCFKKVISTFKEARETAASESIDFEIIKENLLSDPYTDFEELLDKIFRMYSERVEDIGITETLGQVWNMFYWFGRCIRCEYGNEALTVPPHEEAAPQEPEGNPAKKEPVRAIEIDEANMNFTDPDFQPEEIEFEIDPIM